jgi:hypothetical protein
VYGLGFDIPPDKGPPAEALLAATDVINMEEGDTDLLPELDAAGAAIARVLADVD